jgi:glycosyltransferase involved in cell wall biosynthesis
MAEMETHAQLSTERPPIIQYHFIYGAPIDSASGGTKLQNELFSSLESIPGVVIRRHVVSNLMEAEAFVLAVKALPVVPSSAFLVDGLGAVWLSPQTIEDLRMALPACMFCGFIHFPFSTQFYEQEPWLDALKPTADATLLHNQAPLSGESWLRRYERLLFKSYDKMVAVGPFTAATLRGDFGLPSEKIVIIDAPVTPLVFSIPPRVTPLAQASVETSSGSSAPSQKRTLAFVTVGTVCGRKRQHTLIRAFGKFVQQLRRGSRRTSSGQGTEEVDNGQNETSVTAPVCLRLVVVGDLSSDPLYAEECRKAAAEVSGEPPTARVDLPSSGCSGLVASSSQSHGDELSDHLRWSLSVTLTGPLPQEEALAQVAAADAFVFASAFESYGLAPLEAAAVGVPVVTSSCGVLRDLLPPSSTVFVEEGGGGNAGLAQGQNVTAWCTALHRFLVDEAALKGAAQANAPGFREAHKGAAADSGAQIHRAILECMV